MPKLIQLYLKHVAIGFAISVVFVAGLLYLNIANLWHLVSHSDVAYLAVFMLVFINGIVFSGVQFAIVIMTLPDEDNDSGGKRQPMASMALAPVKIDRR
ncbi:MAG: hypothetical protein ABJO67_02365 [Pseudoruegeria sp.]